MASRALRRRLTTDETLELSGPFESGSTFSIVKVLILSSTIDLWQHHQQDRPARNVKKWRVKFWHLLTHSPRFSPAKIFRYTVCTAVGTVET